MKTATLRNKIKKAGEISHGKNQSFNDKQERNALRNFLSNCRPFQSFWKNYFGMAEDAFLMDDPLGECRVDMGLVSVGQKLVYGLIEVDVFNSWGTTFPLNYKKFHALERKLKYFQGTDYKYLTCTFNNRHNQMCCTTRENIEKCLELYGVTEMWMPAIGEYDRVIRCPIDSEVKWFSITKFLI